MFVKINVDDEFVKELRENEEVGDLIDFDKTDKEQLATAIYEAAYQFVMERNARKRYLKSLAEARLKESEDWKKLHKTLAEPMPEF